MRPLYPSPLRSPPQVPSIRRPTGKQASPRTICRRSPPLSLPGRLPPSPAFPLLLPAVTACAVAALVPAPVSPGPLAPLPSLLLSMDLPPPAGPAQENAIRNGNGNQLETGKAPDAHEKARRRYETKKQYKTLPRRKSPIQARIQANRTKTPFSGPCAVDHPRTPAGDEKGE